MLEIKGKKFECIKKTKNRQALLNSEFLQSALDRTIKELVGTVIVNTTSSDKMRVYVCGLFCPKNTDSESLCAYVGIDGTETIERCKEVRNDLYPIVSDNILTVAEFCGEALITRFILEKYDKIESLGKHDYAPTCIGISIPYKDLKKYSRGVGCEYLDKNLNDDDIVCIVKKYTEKEDAPCVEYLVQMRGVLSENNYSIIPLDNKPSENTWGLYTAIIKNLERGCSFSD